MFNGFRCKCLNTLCVSKCYKQPFTYVECNITLKQEEMGVTKNPSAVAKMSLNTTTQFTIYHQLKVVSAL